MASQFKQTVGGVMQKMRQADRTARMRFMNQGREIVRYGWAPDYGFEYQTLPGNAFFRAKVAKTSQAIKVFGPYLYQQNPNRTFSVREDADIQMTRRAQLASQYGNYCIGEYDYRLNCRRAIDDGISWGAGVLWTGRHPHKENIIASMWDSVRDMMLDADATCQEEQKRLWRRRCMPRKVAIEMYPEFAETFAKVPLSKSRNDQDGRLAWETPNNADSSQLITWWELWTTYPLSIYDKGESMIKQAEQEGIQFGTHPQKHLMTDDGLYIGSTDWEVPFYLDDEWPCTMLGFFNDQDSLYPVSPLQDGIGFQRGMNWLVTLMMGKYRFTSRTALAIKTTNGQGLTNTDQDKLLIGNDIEALKITVNGEGLKLSDFVEQFNWSQDYLQHGMAFLQLMEKQYERATGLSDILFSGEGSTQSRSATDAQMRDTRSMSRVNDMQQQVVDWQDKVARKEALAGRFLMGPQNIGTVLGDLAANDWGILMKPDENSANALMQQMMQSGLPPEEAQMEVQRILSQAVDYDKWAAETDYTIEADSIRRKDSQQMVDVFKELSNQLIPSLVQSMDPADKSLGFMLQAEYIKALGGKQELVQALNNRAQQLQMMPPPMPAQPETEGPPK
jgi:hypothetical protein